MRLFNRLLRLVFGLFLNLIYLAATLFPRDPARWVFGAWNGKKFLDNPKFIFIHTLQTMPDVQVVWITRCRKLAQELRRQGLPAAYAGSLMGIWAQLRAGVVIFSHSVEWDLWAPLIARRVLRVQTWHGMPIKHIGYDDKRDISARRAGWISLIYPYRNDHLDLVTAAGPADQACYRSAFNVQKHAVVVTGYARNDAIFRSTRDGEIKTRLIKNAIYMPTLRGPAGSEFPLFEFTKFDFKAIDGECKKIGLHLWVKLHPVQKFRKQDLDSLNRCENLHAYIDKGDIYEKLGQYDILITDFSGIYFDFLISGRPIILAPLDIAEYIANDRSLYYKYDDLCCEPACVSWGQVLKRLKELCIADVKPSEGYRDLQGRFHYFLDDNSSQRVSLRIRDLSLRRTTVDRAYES
jgi:CDP-glycerol glycerophosphotransferase